MYTCQAIACVLRVAAAIHSPVRPAPSTPSGQKVGAIFSACSRASKPTSAIAWAPSARMGRCRRAAHQAYTPAPRR